jgi:hypothetical protein
MANAVIQQQHDGLPHEPQRSGAKAGGTIAALVAVPSLYLIFVAHFWFNVPYEDDWTRVPLIHAALHGTLNFGTLWALDNQSRTLFPNSVFVGLGVLTHDDLRAVVALSAVLFIATFYLFLLVVRSYLARPLTPFLIVVIGAVWFSLENWHNALWAFQFSWYLVLLCLVALVWLLQVARRRTLTFALAVVAAVVASFSFLQGLALWPVGLICLLWTFSLDSREAKRRILEASIWVAAALATTVTALWGYDFKPLGCSAGAHVQTVCGGASVSSFAVHHPWIVVEWILVAIGEIVPNTHAATLWLNGLLGAVLLAVAIAIVVQSVRHRFDGRNCLPTALIIFGLLFDFLIAVLRAELLTISWVNSSYAMPNLLILLAIVIYAWGRLAHAHVPRTFAVIGVALLVVQFAVTTRSGFAGSRAFDQHQATAGQLAVNLDAVMPQEQNCYDLYGVLPYLLFPVVNYVGYAEAKADHLSVFAPDFRHEYRAEGLPKFPQCRGR